MLVLVVVPIRSSRLWETPKGGELMGVDMLLLDEKLPDAEVCAFIVLKLIIFGKSRFADSINPANKILMLISKLLTNVWKRTMEQSRRTLSSINLSVVVRRLPRSAGDLY
ncbi:unnamed protein product [Brassica oleracea var. botrytis]